MKQLPGSQLWDGWFALVEDSLTDEDFIPRQALTFVHMALQKIQFTVDVVAEHHASAKASYEGMQKRRKNGI